MTTTTLVTLLIVGTSAVYAVQTKDDTIDSKPTNTRVKFKLIEHNGEQYLDVDSFSITSLTVPVAPQDEPQNVTPPSSTAATPTLEDSVAVLLNTFTQQAPKVQTIIQEAAAQPQEKRVPATINKLATTGQELLADDDVSRSLSVFFGSNQVNTWTQKLSSHSRRTEEKTLNQEVLGIQKKTHYAINHVLNAPNRDELLKKVVNHPELLNSWLSKADRFPGNGTPGTSLKEMLNKAEYEKNKS